MEVVKTALWFLKRPSFWPHAAALGARKLKRSFDTLELRAQASAWAAARAVSVPEALRHLGLIADNSVPVLPPSLRQEAEQLASAATVHMGGPGDIGLLYAAAVLVRAERIVETGVAYGWSSLALLAALDSRGEGSLVSVDMPYPKMDNEPWVGVAVPTRLRSRWTLIRRPDRFGLRRAIAKQGHSINLCHYDSDKSYPGRRYAYPLLWDALVSGGVFISDDIQDNFGFRDFVEAKGCKFAVTEYQGKYVGIMRKP